MSFLYLYLRCYLYMYLHLYTSGFGCVTTKTVVAGIRVGSNRLEQHTHHNVTPYLYLYLYSPVCACICICVCVCVLIGIPVSSNWLAVAYSLQENITHLLVFSVWCLLVASLVVVVVVFYISNKQ